MGNPNAAPDTLAPCTGRAIGRTRRNPCLRRIYRFRRAVQGGRRAFLTRSCPTKTVPIHLSTTDGHQTPSERYAPNPTIQAETGHESLPSAPRPHPQHARRKLVEQFRRVVRPRRSLRVILDREHRTVPQTEPRDRAIIQMDPRDDAPRRLQRLPIDREPVILARDRHATGLRIQHRLVRAAMPERELIGLRPDRLRQQLVPEADPEHRNLRPEIEHAPDNLCRLRHRGRVTGPVRDEQTAVRAITEPSLDLVRGHVVRQHTDRQPTLTQVPQDVVLRTAIQHRDDRLGLPATANASTRVPPSPRAQTLAPRRRRCSRDPGNEVGPLHRRRRPCPRHQLRICQRRIIRDRPGNRPRLTDTPGQRPRVDPCNPQHARVPQVPVQIPRRPEVRGRPRQLMDDEPRDMDPRRLDVFGVHPRVADQRRRLHKNLPRIRRIGQRFLVPRQRRVEHDLRRRHHAQARRAECLAAKHATIGKRQSPDDTRRLA